MKTNALFIVLGIIGILVLIILAYGLEISHLIFDFKWKKKIKSFWKRSQKFFQSLVRTKMKRVKGKIIRLKQKKFPMVASSSLDGSFNLIQSLYNQPQPVALIGYFVFFEDERKHQRCFIEISKESFEELEKEDISSLKNISLLFERWFWGTNYHHYERA